MTAEMLVIRPTVPTEVAEVAPRLREVFIAVQEAITSGSAVVMVVPSQDLLGHRTTAGAAFVGSLVGMTRAVAFEGVKPGWKINALAVPAESEVSDDEARAAVAIDGLTGQVVTVGTALIGKVIP